MKHIFTIHSHITFLAAVGTIIRENLPTEEVILVCGGNYKPKLSNTFKGKIVKSYEILEASYSFFGKLKNWNYTKSANKFIDQLIQGEDYIAYIDLMSVFNRYLVMHPKSIQFHIIEEGIVNYSDFDDFNLWTVDLRQFPWQWKGFAFKQMLNACTRLVRGRSLRLLALPIHPNLYTLHQGVKAFCFSEYAFQYTSSKQKVVLNWNTLDTYVSIEQENYKDGSWIWIGDTLCSSYGISMLHFESALQQLLEKVNPNKEENTIYLKFRGSESNEEKEITLQYLANYNFKVEFIASETIMELAFLKSKNLKVCGIRSSLLIYANLIGHATYSLYPYIPNDYGLNLDKNYSIISKKVGFI